MKDSKAFWLQVILSAAIPYLLGGSIIYVLSQFRERLPEWSYNTVIFTIYVVFIVILLVLVVLLIRFAFGEWLNKLRISIENRRRHHARQKMAEEWYEKWRDLCELLGKVIHTDWQPTKEQENEYSKLRSWFRRNRSKLLPIWHSFEYPRRKMAHEYYGSSTSLGHEVFYDNHDDPFSYFYEPFGIEELDKILEYHMSDVGDVLIKLLELTDEFVEWTSLK